MRDALLELSLLYGKNDRLPPDRFDNSSSTQPAEDTTDKSQGKRLSLSREYAANNGNRTGERTPSHPRQLRIAPGGRRRNRQDPSGEVLKRNRDPEIENETGKDSRQRALEYPNAHRWRKRSRSMSDPKWKWGPGATSHMAMKFYDAVYHLPYKGTAKRDLTTNPDFGEPGECDLLPSPYSSSLG